MNELNELEMKNYVHRPLQIEKSICVSTYDIDFAGIVSNIVYIRWLEDLRLKFLKTYLRLDRQLANGYAPILSGTDIDYKRPTKLFDQVVGRIWILNLGKVKWMLQAEIITNQQVAAIAVQKGAFVDLNTSRLVPIPDELHYQYRASIGKL